MKINRLLTLMGLSSLLFLSSGCFTIMHEEAAASLDLPSGSFSGPSPLHIGGKTPSENAEWLMIEPWLTSVGSASSGKSFDQSDPLGDYSAGGPSDGARSGIYNWRPMRPAAAQNQGYFAISEGLEFVGKGFKITQDNGSESDNLYYLEIPVQANYIVPMEGGHELRFGAGPYIAAGLFGNYSGNFGGQSESGSLKFGSNKDYALMDYGAVLSASYMVTPKISLTANYDFGLRNINMSADKIYNRTIGLSVGYRIK
ncbi:MAG: PorT family protein [Bacteroidetes bacterium]|nr:PorT family protein [Bacteroidota bacterium]